MVVVLLLPLFLSMYDDELDHGVGGVGGGGPAAVAAAAVAAMAVVDNDWRQKWPATRALMGHMTECNDKSRRRTTTQQPTNEEISKSGQWCWQQ